MTAGAFIESDNQRKLIRSELVGMQLKHLRMILEPFFVLIGGSPCVMPAPLLCT